MLWGKNYGTIGKNIIAQFHTAETINLTTSVQGLGLE
jgi:hypothetical protein